MNIKKLEKEVINNSLQLEKKMPSLLNKYKNKFIVYNKGECHYETSFEKGVEYGIKHFGENVGFVVKKITKQIPTFPSLVKLS